MDFAKVCRTCMGEENLMPMFTENDILFSRQIYAATGVKILPDDGLPQNLCSTCVTYLNNTIEFQTKCKQTEMQLKKHIDKNMIRTKYSKPKVKRKNKNTKKDHRKDDLLKSEMKTDNLEEFNEEEDKIKEDPSGCKRTDMEIEYTDLEMLDEIFDEEEDKPLIYLTEYDPAEINLEKTLYDTSNIEKLKTLKEETCEEVKTTNKLTGNFDSCPHYNKCENSTRDKGKRVTCHLCQRDLSVRSVDAHMSRRHPGADERRAKCELCDAYVLRGKMARHTGRVHAGGSGCAYCKSKFENKDQLIGHVATCAAKKKKRKASESARELRECDVCHKIMQRASLKMHKAVTHAGLRPVCEHCGRRFGNKLRLAEHRRAKHGYEKIQCRYCDFRSAGEMAMRNHVRRHRGEKPFVCEACGAGFHAAYLLAQHRHSHRTERPLQCGQCSARFKAANSLHVHRRQVHGAARHRCGVCARAYASRHYALRHLRRVHRYTGPAPPPLLPAAGPAAPADRGATESSGSA